jgi:flagellar hook-basal body complex protein FliE
MKIQPLATGNLGAPADVAPTPSTQGESFGSILGKMVGEANQMQQQGDRKIAGTLMGKEDLHESMLALEKASLGFKLLIQVRNKLVEAYQELNRMPL